MHTRAQAWVKLGLQDQGRLTSKIPSAVLEQVVLAANEQLLHVSWAGMQAVQQKLQALQRALRASRGASRGSDMLTCSDMLHCFGCMVCAMRSRMDCAVALAN